MEEAIREFSRKHGRAPTEIVVSPAAAVVLAAQSSMPPFVGDVPLRVGEPDRPCPWLVLTDLPGGRQGVVAGEFDGRARA